MKTCANCGCRLADDKLYCDYCGSPQPGAPLKEQAAPVVDTVSVTGEPGTAAAERRNAPETPAPPPAPAKPVGPAAPVAGQPVGYSVGQTQAAPAAHAPAANSAAAQDPMGRPTGTTATPNPTRPDPAANSAAAGQPAQPRYAAPPVSGPRYAGQPAGGNGAPPPNAGRQGQMGGPAPQNGYPGIPQGQQTGPAQLPPPRQPGAPVYGPVTGQEPDGGLSTAQYFWTMVLFAIPLVGLAFMLYWSFGDTCSPARQRFARASLIRTGIATVTGALVLTLVAGIFVQMWRNILPYWNVFSGGWGYGGYGGWYDDYGYYDYYDGWYDDEYGDWDDGWFDFFGGYGGYSDPDRYDEHPTAVRPHGTSGAQSGVRTHKHHNVHNK